MILNCVRSGKIRVEWTDLKISKWCACTKNWLHPETISCLLRVCVCIWNYVTIGRHLLMSKFISLQGDLWDEVDIILSLFFSLLIPIIPSKSRSKEASPELLAAGISSPVVSVEKYASLKNQRKSATDV